MSQEGRSPTLARRLPAIANLGHGGGDACAVERAADALPGIDGWADRRHVH